MPTLTAKLVKDEAVMSRSSAMVASGLLIIAVTFAIRWFHQPGDQQDLAPLEEADPKANSSANPPRRGPYMVPRSEPQAAVPVAPESPKRKAPDYLVPEKPPGQARHIAAQHFMQSAAKDTVEGQTIARELIQNGYGPEYISILYNSALRLWATNNIKTADPATFADIFSMREKAVKDQLRLGTMSIPAITNSGLVDRLLELRPTKPYQNGPLITAGPGPDDRLLTSQDILDYISAHPAPTGNQP